MRVPEVVDISDDEDDEISVIYSTPPPVNKGATKSDAISVEYYHPRKLKGAIDEVEVVRSFPKSRKRNFKGECSNSKKPRNTESSVPAANFFCEICADEKPKNEIFRIQGCGHSYCSDCMKKYVASKLQDNITAISCPFPGCGGLLEPHHCRPILPEQVFNRWGDALCEAMILAKEKFYCPFKDCSALLLDDNTDGISIAEAECPNCNRLFCGKCKVPWHTGIECVEFQRLKNDERSTEDIALMKLAKDKGWTRCPNCGIYVEKKEGCFYITCRCRSNFCYYCGSKNVSHGGHVCKEMMGSKW